MNAVKRQMLFALFIFGLNVFDRIYLKQISPSIYLRIIYSCTVVFLPCLAYLRPTIPLITKIQALIFYISHMLTIVKNHTLDLPSNPTLRSDSKDLSKQRQRNSGLEEELSGLSGGQRMHSEVKKLQKELKKKNDIIKEYIMIVDSKKVIIHECQRELKK